LYVSKFDPQDVQTASYEGWSSSKALREFRRLQGLIVSYGMSGKDDGAVRAQLDLLADWLRYRESVAQAIEDDWLTCDEYQNVVATRFPGSKIRRVHLRKSRLPGLEPVKGAGGHKVFLTWCGLHNVAPTPDGEQQPPRLMSAWERGKPWKPIPRSKFPRNKGAKIRPRKVFWDSEPTKDLHHHWMLEQVDCLNCIRALSRHGAWQGWKSLDEYRPTETAIGTTRKGTRR
jgi:hypothetical protein